MIMITVVLLAIIGTAIATTGVDVSQLFSTSDWQCLTNYGYKFGIVRCYRSSGSPDPNCAQSVTNAWAGGMEHVDIYMFPCPKCGNARGQVQALKNHAANIKFGQVWLDIEGTQYWLGTHDQNRAFFKELAAASQELFGSKFGGVYTNVNQWEPIFGTWTEYSYLRLWWAFWDKSPSWSGWKPFDGWNHPAIKQYAGDDSLCGMSIDKNFY